MNKNISTAFNSKSQDYNYNAWREKFIMPALRISCILGIGLVIISFSSAPLRDQILFPTLLAFLFGVTFLPASFTLRAFTLLGITFAIGVNGILTLGTWTDASIFLFAFVVLASLLFDNNINLFALAIALLTLFGFAILHQIGVFIPFATITPEIAGADWAIYIADFTISGIVAVVAIRQLKQEFGRVIQQAQNAYQTVEVERSQLEGKVRERTEELENRTFQLQASTSIARTIGEIQNVPDLLNTSVVSTAEQFGFYHVGIYLLDNQKQVAFLQASSSAIGNELIGLGHRVDGNTKNPINHVIEKKQIYTASDIGGSLFIKDANFPITRSRVSIPLSVRGDIIGVFDIHSDQVQSFNKQDIEVFQALADLIAISLDNVRLIGEAQALVEQLSFYNATQAHESWSKNTNRRRSPAYQYTPAGVRPIFTQLKKEEEDIAGTLFVPLTLQGQKIGNIKLRRKGFLSNWTEKEKGMVEKVAEQISLALENSRLVDEAQKSAKRDQIIANISSRVRETLDIEAVIRTATTEFRKVFDLKEAEISVGLPQAEPKPIRKNTSTLRLK